MSERIIKVADLLAEVIPALLAAGWSDQRIRRWGDEVMTRMGEGGPSRDWLRTMGDVIAESRDERAIVAATLAFKELDHQ